MGSLSTGGLRGTDIDPNEMSISITTLDSVNWWPDCTYCPLKAYFEIKFNELTKITSLAHCSWEQIFKIELHWGNPVDAWIFFSGKYLQQICEDHFSFRFPTCDWRNESAHAHRDSTTHNSLACTRKKQKRKFKCYYDVFTHAHFTYNFEKRLHRFMFECKMPVGKKSFGWGIVRKHKIFFQSVATTTSRPLYIKVLTFVGEKFEVRGIYSSISVKEFKDEIEQTTGIPR